MNTRSLQFRLVVWYSALVILVVLCWAGFTYRSLEHGMRSEIVETLTRRVNAIADYMNEGISRKELREQIEAVYSPEASSRFIRITKQDETSFYISGKPKDGLFDPYQIPFIASKKTAVRNVALPSGQDMIIVTIVPEINGQHWWIEMGALSEQIDSALRELLLTLAIGLPVVILLAMTGGYLLVHHALKPVEAIRATAAQITFGNLSNRLPVPASGDALAHLSATLNQMLVRLEDAYHQAMRFSADAGHELRTPLTIMRTELESMVQEPSISAPFQERIASVLEEAEHLSRITEQLMILTRLDAGEARAETTSIELGELVRSTAEQMQLLATDKQLAVIIDTQTVTVRGDLTRLRQMVVNLIDNAVKYSPRGGTVRLTAYLHEHNAVFDVEDNGIGIAAEALPHVFDRFYRADKARSREENGSGLGLAIVSAIVQAHGGNIAIQSHEGAGTKVSVTLPALERGSA